MDLYSGQLRTSYVKLMLIRLDPQAKTGRVFKKSIAELVSIRGSV